MIYVRFIIHVSLCLEEKQGGQYYQIGEVAGLITRCKALLMDFKSCFPSDKEHFQLSRGQLNDDVETPLSPIPLYLLDIDKVKQ